MRILAVDDEKLSLEGLVTAIRLASPEAEIRGFSDGDEALQATNEFLPDVAFLDIELRGESGILLAIKLKELNPKINIIFVTGYSDYMKEAFDLHASGYVLKPVDEEAIRTELENLRFDTSAKGKKKLTVRAFGRFEVFSGGIPLTFGYSRTSELLAVLVDANGSLLPVEHVVEVMWEGNDNKANRSYFRNLLTDLRRTLNSVGASDVILSVRGSIGLDRNKIDCDYFDFRDRKADALDAFHDEYMSQFSWAESTLGAILSGKL